MSLKNLGDIKNNKKLEDSILEKIYQSNNQPDKIHKNNYDIERIRVRSAFLKPAIVFLSVFMFFSLSFAGTVYASASSLPGDMLYNVKRTYENVQIVFTPYANERKLYFNFLNKRIYEADALLNRDDTINKEAMENLLGEIDYNYGKCMEHKSFSKNEGERIGKHINSLRETFQERYGTNCNSNGQKANSNQNLEQQHNNTTQNLEQQINNNSQSLEQQQGDSNQNTNQQQGNNNQDTEGQSGSGDQNRNGQ